MVTQDLVIEVVGLTKYYRGVRGVEDVSFGVARGETFGFLGPNGAGKTTCIRLLLDLLRADRGEILLFGNEISCDRWRFKSRVGNLPGEVAWWPTLAGREILDAFAGLNPRPARLQPELLDRLGLPPELLRRKVRTYSRGTRQKLGIVVAMQHDPDLVILDEPTSGLDPLVRHAFFEICHTLKQRGKTIFFSSHNLSETQEISDRVAIIRSGRLAVVDSIAGLRAKSVRRVEVSFGARPAHDWLRLPGARVLETNGNKVVLTCSGSPAPLLRELLRHPVSDIVVTPPTLEDLFLCYYREPGEEPPGSRAANESGASAPRDGSRS